MLYFVNETFFKNTFQNLCLGSIYKKHFNEIHQIVEWLKDGKSLSGSYNQYFYAHILNPHEPLVFDENGGVSSKVTFQGFLVQKQLNVGSDAEGTKAYTQMYVNQIKSLNALVLKALNSILSQYSKEDLPIIILHGDHGRTLARTNPKRYELSNLFAIYVPPAWREEARNLNFTNLYRFILNHIFGARYPYLSPFYYVPLKPGSFHYLVKISPD